MKMTITHMRYWMLLLLAVLGVSVLEAQSIGNYAVTQIASGVPYNSIEFTGSSLPAWRNNTAGDHTEDDNRSFPQLIGFDFWYNGVRYTSFSVSTNGFLDFSDATYDGGPGIGTRQYWPYGPYDADLSSSARTNGLGGTNLAIAPIYFDITTQGEIDPLGESIKYLVTGTAPNRVLTIEWIRMAVYGNTTPNLNYQVKLYESTGVIEMIYGTMNPGTGVTWSYSCGLSGVDANATHLIQTTANTATFSTSSTQNNLATIPSSNSSIDFTPPAIAAPTGLTFGNLTQTQMQLNWTDNATNEVGYAIYRSDDGGTTYNFITQTPANTTSYLMTNLLAGTRYYYKVYAVNEGRLSTPLLGNQSTVVPATFTSIKTGDWNDPLTWNNPGQGVPDITSAVTISDGHTVTVNANAFASTITVGQGASGTLLIGNSDNAAKTISVTGNIVVNTGATMQVNTASIQSGHTINTTGNIINSGILDLAPNTSSRCIVNFSRSGTQTISGNGSKTNFYLMNLNMGASNTNLLDVFATNFTNATAGFLTITNGTFRLSAGATVNPFNASASVPANGGLWLNHASAVVNTTGGNLTIAGFLRVSNGGTLNVGTAADQNLVSNGGTFIIDQGTINIAGRFEPLNNYTLTNFTMSGGTIVVPTVGSTSSVNAPFTINVSGSNFETTGGTIIIRRAGAGNLGYMNLLTATSNVLGGTLQIGDSQTPASQTMQIKTDIPLFNLLVNGPGAKAQVVTNPLTIQNDVTIAASGMTLDPNNLNLTVGGNWTDNGSFLRGTGTVTLYSTSIQTISDPTGETFKNLTINKYGGSVTLNGNVVVDSVFTLAQGTFNVSSKTLTFNYTATNAGTFTVSTTAPLGTVIYNQTTAGQTILPVSYGNLTLNALSKTFASGGTIGIAGTFTVPNPATAHVMTGSTVDYNGLAQTVAATTTNFVYNNLSMSGSGIKTASGAITVNGSLSTAAAVTYADAGYAMIVKGNIAHAGTHTGTGRIEVNGGTASHTISGGGSFSNFTMNDVLGATLSGTMTVNGTLTFTTGVITTGTDTVFANGTVARTSGHVNGWLKKTVTTANSGQAITFDIGDAAVANYTPAVFTFTTITGGGTLCVSTVADQHPLIGTAYIDPTDDVNRYWTLKAANGFAFTAASKYTAKFTFLSNDLSQTTNVTRYKINCYSTTWDSAGTTTATTTTNQGAGFAVIGSYAIGLQNASNMYRSITSGNWTTVSIWQRYNSSTGTWVAASVYPNNTNAASITIQSPNTVTVTTNLSGTTNGQDQLVIDAGATLDVTTGGTFQVRNGAGTDLTVFGTFKTSGGTISTNGTPTISIEAGGTYIHGINGGTIPAATWDPLSNCIITGVTNTVPSGLNQTFGNFNWNCTGQSGTINLAGNPTSVTGEFRVTSTGTQTLTLNDNTAATKSVGGNFVVAGGNVAVKSTGSTAYAVTVGGDVTLSGTGTTTLTQSSTSGGNVTVTIGGNVAISAGTLNFSSGSTSATLNVSKDFSHTAGTMTETSSGSGSIIFLGGRIQNYTSGGTVSNVINYTVNSGTTLQLGTSILTGGGTFTLANGASIGLGSASGISSTAGTGNVQVTGTRTFNIGANYIYNGGSAQVTGNAMPSTVNKLVINNAAGVTLTTSTTVSDTLFLTSGQFSIGSLTLTLNSGVVGSGTLSAPSGTVSYNQPSNGQNVLVGNYGTLIFSNYNKVLPAYATIGIATSFVPGTATGHTLSSSTFNYNGGTQNVAGFSYFNLTTSGTGAKTLTGDATVANTLTLGGGSFADGGYTLTANGNISNSVAHTGTGRIYLNGSSSEHQLTGGGSYGSLEINDEYGAYIQGNTTINGTLTLTRGIIRTTDTLQISTTGLVVRPTTGLPRHVNGFLKKTIPAISTGSETVVFEIGNATDYTPIELTFTSVTTSGTITASTVSSVHPNIASSGLDQTKNVRRYWRLAPTGIVTPSYDATFTFVAGDIGGGANTGYFYVKRFSNLKWYPAVTNLRTSVSTKAVSIAGFGDFVTGELVPFIFWTGYGDGHSWSDINNWSTITVPTTYDNVILDYAGSINVDVPGTCKNLTLNNGALVLTIKSGQSLTLSGDTLTQNAGTFNTEEAFPILAGSTHTVQFVGGTFGFIGTIAQSVPAVTYNNLVLGGNTTKTALGGITVNGDLTINTGSTFVGGSYTHSLAGNWINNGVYTPGTSTVVLNGSASTQLDGTSSTTFITLTVAKASDAQVVTVGNSVSVGTLNVTTGRMETGSNTVTVTTTRTGNGIIIGTITHTHTFTPGIAYEFEGPNNLITFNTGGTLPTSVTETVVLQPPSGTTLSMDPINRCYTLAMTGGTGCTYTYRLHYEVAEVVSPNTNDATLRAWHESSPGSNAWDRKGATSADYTTAHYVELTGVSLTDVGRWTLSSRKQADLSITLTQDKSHPVPGDIVVYSIVWKNNGDGDATNSILTAQIPANTTYVPNSVMSGAVAKTDLSTDGDGVSYNTGDAFITINLNTLIGNTAIPPYATNPSQGTGTITYKVTIQ